MEVLQRFAEAIENMPVVAVQGIDREGIIHIWNEASVKLYGISRAEAIGRHFCDLLTFRGNHAELKAALAGMWDSGLPASPRDLQIVTPSGRVVWVYSAMFPAIASGHTRLVFCMDIDITQRKEQEQHLLESETRIRKFFDKSADAIIMVREGQIQEFNPAALRLFGYGEQQSGLKGATPSNISPRYQPDGRLSQEKMEEMHAIALATGSHRFEWQYCTCDKRAFWGEVTLTALDDRADSLLYAMVRDITDRKNAERELQLSAQVFENSHEGIIILDAEWRIVRVNAAFTAMTGFTEQEILGMGKSVLRSSAHDAGFYEGIRATVGRNGHWQGELWGGRRDSETFPAWASISAVRSGDGRRYR